MLKKLEISKEKIQKNTIINLLICQFSYIWKPKYL